MLQPSKRHAYAQTGDNVFTPVERELIFDIVSYSISEASKNPIVTFVFAFKFVWHV